MNTRIILVGIMLFSMANYATGNCIMFDFGNFADGYAILNAYDESGLFNGYLVCFDYDASLVDTATDIHGYSGRSITINKGDVEIEIYNDVSDVPKCDFGSRSTRGMRNVSIEQIDINGYPATYFTREEKAGTEHVDRETGKPLLDTSSKSYHEAVLDAMSKTMNNDFRVVSIYKSYATLYLQIDSNTVLTMSGPYVDTQDNIRVFKSFNISKISGENPRYFIKEGNRLFNEGSLEEALIIYGKLAEYNKYPPAQYETTEVIDNMGIALYKLGKYNESLDWFDRKHPRSSQTWNIYGQLLKSKNFTDEAEYAFYRAQLD